MLNVFRPITVLSLLILLAACGGSDTDPMAEDAMTMTPASWDSRVQYWEKPDIDWNTYSRLNVRDMIVTVHEDFDEEDIYPGLADDISLLISRAVAKRMQPLARLMEWPGPSTLMLEMRLMHLKPAGEPLAKYSDEQLPQPIDLSEAMITAKVLGPEQIETLAVMTLPVSSEKLTMLEELNTVIETTVDTLIAGFEQQITLRRPSPKAPEEE